MLVVPADADRCACGKPIRQGRGIDYLTDGAVETVYLCLKCFRKVAQCGNCAHFDYYNDTHGFCRCLPNEVTDQAESYLCGQWLQGDLVEEER